MEYKLEEINKRIEFCIKYLNYLTCDILCGMFIICSYISYKAALQTDGYRVNRSSLSQCGYNTVIYDYRNAYAHIDLDKIVVYAKQLIEVLPLDIEYTDSMNYYISRFKDTYK